MLSAKAWLVVIDGNNEEIDESGMHELEEAI